MKTPFTAAAFALTLGLSSLAHAGFNDQGPTVDTRSATTATMRQDLSHLATVTGFNQQSHYAAAVNRGSQSSPSLPLGANCDLNRMAGFQNSTSVASC